jgi:hemin uptake protein HemP
MNSTIDLKTLNLIAGDAYAGDVSNDMRKQASLPTNVMGKDCWCSGELLGQRKMTRIEHDGCVYMLRVTKENRLILTK